MLTRGRVLAGLAALLLLSGAYSQIESQSVSAVTPPEAEFGAAIGDDYFLASYTQLESYWQRIARESDRVQLVDIGRTAEGRRQWMAVVSAAENLAELDRYRDISRRLALAEGLTDEQARRLAVEGKAIVVIAGGLHANETLGAQQLIELVYQLAGGTDEETLRILRDVIVLVVHANPDGHELVANWYMREEDETRRTLSDLPSAYQKYVGHDNNRDFYMSTQAETINMNRVLYREWFPQIVYDHHQAAPPGTVMFAPPFRGPFNYVLDPLIPGSIELLGGAMHVRFAAEGKAGVTTRDGSTYSTWWNGGLRTTAYFHNQIGLLTETIGSPTPIEIPFVPGRQVPSPDLPAPIAPQRWHFRQSIEYSMTANRAVLDVASKFRESLLFGVYRMGKNSIERGSRDFWTRSPRRAAEARLQDPAARDPRGYILPSDQPDFPTAAKFVAALINAGVRVHRATASFVASGVRYPAGSFIVKTAQAFRPHVLDMFEPQDHPDDAPYPGGPPVPPYDIAGWTLAFQMGVKFDRVLDAFEGPFEVVERVHPPEGNLTGPPEASGYLLSHHQNDAFIAANRLIRAGESVLWPRDRSMGGDAAGTGVMYAATGPRTRQILRQAASELGLQITGVPEAPPRDALRLRAARVGLWDRYGGSSASGWLRWLLEQYEFSFELVYAQDLGEADLIDRFDVIIFSSDANLDRRTALSTAVDRLPAEYRRTTGSLTTAGTLPRLQQFVREGGTLVSIGEATSIAQALGVPVSSALVRDDRPLTREQYYIPGSILRMTVDPTTPLGFGFEREVDVFVDDSPVFRLDGNAEARGTRRVGWFATAAPLRSGWARGQEHLLGGVAVVDAEVGRGRVFLFGPEIAFRGQSHGTFKFLFNAIYYGSAQSQR